MSLKMLVKLLRPLLRLTFIYLLSSPVQVQAQVVTLSPDPIDGFRYDPSGDHIVYTQNDSLIVTTVSGQPILNLTNSRFRGFSSDGSKLILSNRGIVNSLFTIPISGGDIVDLASTIPDNRRIGQFTQVESTIVYSATAGNSSTYYSVAESGGIPIQLQLSPNLSFVPQLKLAPDGQHVIYEGQLNNSSQRGIYRTPTNGGPSIQIGSTGTLEFVEVDRIIITQDSSRAIYSTRSKNVPNRLFCVATDGSDTVELTNKLMEFSNPDSAGNPDNFNPPARFQVSADGQRVFYISDGDLFSVSVSGEGKIQLDNNNIRPGDLLLTKGDSKVILRTDELPASELYSVDVSGENLIQLSSAESQGRNVVFQRLTNDESHVIYLSSKPEGFDFYASLELFSVPVNGGQVQRLSFGITPEGSVGRVGSIVSIFFSRHFAISPDNSYVAYIAEPNGDGVTGLFIAELDGSRRAKIAQDADLISISPKSESLAFSQNRQNLRVAEIDLDRFSVDDAPICITVAKSGEKPILFCL